MRAVPVLLLCTTFASALEVRVPGADGKTIPGEFHARVAPSPVALCLGTPREYARLVPPLLLAGMQVLAAPLGPDDVGPALRWLEAEHGCDPTRVAVIGGDAAARATVRARASVRATVLLSPSSAPEDWPGTRVFTFYSRGDGKTDAVVRALAPHDGSNHLLLPGRASGAKMLGAVPSLEPLIAEFCESSLTDLRVPWWPADDPALGTPGFFGKTLRPARSRDGVAHALMVWAAGDRWHIGGLVDGAFRGTLRFRVGDDRISFPLDTAKEKPAPEVKARVQKRKDTRVPPGLVGERAGFRGKTWIVFALDGLPDGTPLALEFRPARGKPLRLPAGKRTTFTAVRARR